MDPTAWFNPFGLFLMAAILVPNFLFARRYPEAFTASQNKLLEALEQIGRFGCFGFMIIQLPGAVWGFWFPGAQEVYFAYGMVITALYCLIWALCFHRPSLFRALALSILPSLLFLFSGAMLRSVPMIAAAALFAPCHILLSYKNAVLARVYLKKEEATARADFSSVQGGKPKV